MHEKMIMVISMYKERLKYLREEKELKQEEIAALLKIRKNTYSEYESEYKIIPIKHLLTLCEYYHVSMDYLFAFTNKRNYKVSESNINYNGQHQRLKELRSDHHLTQSGLAYQINVAPSTISDYETRHKIIATPFLYDICKKYHISADYLLGKIDEPKYLK